MQSSQFISLMNGVELTEDELSRVVGGTPDFSADAVGPNLSSGWICTISGECNGGGGSCNPFPF
jgi:hypothetical protein